MEAFKSVAIVCGFVAILGFFVGVLYMAYRSQKNEDAFKDLANKDFTDDITSVIAHQNKRHEP